MSSITGNASPMVAANGCTEGFMQSEYPTASITTIVAMFAPATMFLVISFILFIIVFSYPLLLSKSFCFSSFVRLS